MTHKRRVSSLPRFLECPSSDEKAEVRYEPPSPAAEGGSAAHEALRRVPLGEEPDIEAIAKRYGADPEEVDKMYRFGLSAWAKLREMFPNAKTEEPLEGELVRGTADIFSLTLETMAVGDWKSNRVKRGYWEQVAGYASAAVDAYGMPESGFVTVVLIWLRFFEFEVHNLTADDLDGLKKRIASAERGVGKDYSPGPACEFCPRRLKCPAREQLVRSSVASLTDVAGGEISRETLGALYQQRKLIGKALDEYDKALKMSLFDGDVHDSLGNTLSLEEIEKDKLDPLKAWPALVEAGFTEEELAGVITMAKGKVLTTVSNKVPTTAKRGAKGKAKARLYEELVEAGAVSKSVSISIKTTKAKVAE